MFATNDIAMEESDEVGQTEKVDDGKCSRAWMDIDFDKDLL